MFCHWAGLAAFALLLAVFGLLPARCGAALNRARANSRACRGSTAYSLTRTELKGRNGLAERLVHDLDSTLNFKCRAHSLAHHLHPDVKFALAAGARRCTFNILARQLIDTLLQATCAGRLLADRQQQLNYKLAMSCCIVGLNNNKTRRDFRLAANKNRGRRPTRTRVPLALAVAGNRLTNTHKVVVIFCLLVSRSN